MTQFTSLNDCDILNLPLVAAALSSREPDQFPHMPIFHIDILEFEFRADCSVVAVDLITFSSAFKKEPIPTLYR